MIITLIVDYNGYMGVSISGDTQNGWFIRENPDLKWMIYGYCTSILGNSHIDELVVYSVVAKELRSYGYPYSLDIPY